MIDNRGFLLLLLALKSLSLYLPFLKLTSFLYVTIFTCLLFALLANLEAPKEEVPCWPVQIEECLKHIKDSLNIYSINEGLRQASFPLSPVDSLYLQDRRGFRTGTGVICDSWVWCNRVKATHKNIPSLFQKHRHHSLILHLSMFKPWSLHRGIWSCLWPRPSREAVEISVSWEGSRKMKRQSSVWGRRSVPLCERTAVHKDITGGGLGNAARHYSSW